MLCYLKSELFFSLVKIHHCITYLNLNQDLHATLEQKKEISDLKQRQWSAGVWALIYEILTEVNLLENLRKYGTLTFYF